MDGKCNTDRCDRVSVSLREWRRRDGIYAKLGEGRRMIIAVDLLGVIRRLLLNVECGSMTW
jgi:hypothetical protein